MKVFPGYAWPIAVLFGLGVAPFDRVASAQEWPQWRGPNRDGVVTSFSVPQTWPDALELKWKVTVGSGHASPVVAEGKVYIHSRQEDQEVASCRDLDTGGLVWRRRYPAPYRMSSAARGHGKGPKSTPVVQGGRLFTLGIGGILSCFDARTGDLKWQNAFSDAFAGALPLYGTATSPLVVEDLVIAHVGGHDRGALMAFDVETGQVVWRWEGDGPGYASPIVVESEGTAQIVTQTQNFCVGVSANTGDLLWQIPFTTAYDQNIVTPVVYRGMLILSGLEKGTTAIRVTREGDRWSTEQVWHNPEAFMYMNSPVLSGDRLFGLSRRRLGQLFCLDARTGSTLWTSEGRQGENVAMLVSGDLLLFLTTDAELMVVEPGADRFDPIARFSVADSPTWAHPVVLESRILIKDASTLALWSLAPTLQLESPARPDSL